MVKHFKEQKYSSIKSEFLKKGELFEDPEFPANSKSLFFSKVESDVVWKRPKVSKTTRTPKQIQAMPIRIWIIALNIYILKHISITGISRTSSTNNNNNNNNNNKWEKYKPIEQRKDPHQKQEILLVWIDFWSLIYLASSDFYSVI